MEDLDKLIKTTLGEVEKVLSSKTVVGEPIHIGETTLIPLLSVGFGFGAGSGSSKGEEKQSGQGSGSATGGGAGVRPIAVIIIDKDGTRIEPIKGAMAAALEKLTESVPDVIEKVTGKLVEKKKEEGK